MESDVSCLISKLHGDVLVRLNKAAGQHNQGCTQAVKHSSVHGILRKRVKELDSLRGWTGKISPATCAEFVDAVDIALGFKSREQCKRAIRHSWLLNEAPRKLIPGSGEFVEATAGHMLMSGSEH